MTGQLRGVRRSDLRVFPDERGSFREFWRASWALETAAMPHPSPEGRAAATTDPPGPARDTPRFVQGNISHSQPGVLRGLHFHRRQDDYWVLVRGRAFVALVDLRDTTHGSLADGQRPPVMTFEMAPDQAVYIPSGIAHGFLALEELSLLYLVTNEYDGTDELGFAWNDPAAGVPWPVQVPLLSARDAANPPLAALLERLAGNP